MKINYFGIFGKKIKLLISLIILFLVITSVLGELYTPYDSKCFEYLKENYCCNYMVAFNIRSYKPPENYTVEPW
jgi:hypothetical protein